MRIRVHRHADIAMPEQFLHDLGVYAHTQQNGRCTVAQVMEADTRHPRGLQDGAKQPGEARSREVPPVEIAKDKPMLFPSWSGL